MSLVTDNLDYESILTVIPGTEDETGLFAPGIPFDVPCHVMQEDKRMGFNQGQEEVSTVQAITNGTNGLGVAGFRYSVSGLAVSAKAMKVRVFRDENGPHHETVSLP